MKKAMAEGQREQLERQKELERQREAEEQNQEFVKSQKLAAIRQLEERLTKNRELSEQLRKELRNLESEKRKLSSANNDIDARIKRFDHDILEKSRYNEELNLQKNSMFENYQKQLNEIAQQQQIKKAAREERIGGLRAKLAAKQESLIKELEDELSKLSIKRRKNIEKWKRLEIKAKLKIEEQNVKEQIKDEDTGDGRKSIWDNYKKSIEELDKKQNEIKSEIAVLKRQKQHVLLEKRNVPRELAVKESELQKILSRLKSNAEEREALSSELSNLKAELSKFSIHFIKSLVSRYREKAEKIRKEKEEGNARLEAEKKREEEIAKKEKELAEKTNRLEEERRKKEEERKAKEEQKRKALEEKASLKEEKKRQKQAEKQEVREEKPSETEEEPEQKAETENKGLFGFFKQKAKPELRVEEKGIAAEKKTEFFAGLFGKREEKSEEKIEELIGEESSKEPKSEAEELEEAIRSLDLFKKVEKGRKIEERHGILKSIFKEKIKPEAKKRVLGKLFEKEKKGAVREKPAFGKLLEPKKIIKEKADEIIAEKKPRPFKSKKLESFHKILDNAKAALAKNDMVKAKKLYLKASEEYIKLEYSEKKEVYGSLTELYKKLSR